MAAPAHSTDITGNLTADNEFFAFISTSDNTLGTQVAAGTFWGTTYSLGATLTPGVTNYLHIEAINDATGGPAMLVGSFSLSDPLFHFANGTQSLLTNTSNWSAIFNSTNNSVAVQPWVAPGAIGTGILSWGTNDGSNTTWGTRPNIDTSAQFVWSNDPRAYPFFDATHNSIETAPCYFNGCTVDFSTPIFFGAAAVPGPIAGAGLPGLLAGFGAALAWYRKRRVVTN
jgi:hypothetical protein